MDTMKQRPSLKEDVKAGRMTPANALENLRDRANASPDPQPFLTSRTYRWLLRRWEASR